MEMLENSLTQTSAHVGINQTAVRPSFSGLFLLEHLSGQRTQSRLQDTRNARFPLIPNGFILDREPLQISSAAEAQTRYTGSKVPLLWKRGAADTELRKWNLQYLKKTAGDTPVKVLSLDGLATEPTGFENEVLSLSNFIALLKSKKVYLRFSDLLDNAPRLRHDLPLPQLQQIAGNPGRVNLQFFLGPAGTRTPLHSELNCNIFIQIFGRKRWVIFPVEATEQLQPPSARRFYFFSPLDPLAKKKKTDVTLPGALRGWEILLEPGDILLCPPLLWHAVENLTTTCAVGFKYNRLGQAFRASPLLFCMNLLARNPSYFSYIWSAFVRKRHPILATK